MTDPRESLAAFSERVLRRPLWPHQLAAADTDAFVTVIAAARRTGKTTLSEDLAIYTALRERNVIVLILSATEDAARRVTEGIGETLARSQLLRGSVVEGWARRIELTNGSKIVSLPASQRQVRGYGKGVRLVILDEAGFMPSELWTAAHYTALDERPHSRILMLGTPWGARDHFFRRAYEAGMDGDPDHAAFNWTYEVNPKLDAAYLERQRDRVSPAEYAAEVLGEWSDAAGALFPRELLDAQTVDVELPTWVELALPHFSGGARGVVGVDYGPSFDRNATAVVFRVPGLHALNPDAEPLARFVVSPHAWPVKTPLSAPVDAVVAARAPLAYIATEVVGVGAGPSQELERRLRAEMAAEPLGEGHRHKVNFVATTNAKKTAGYGTLLNLLERGQLLLPRHPDLLRQLAGLKFEQGERGFVRIEADQPSVHDDVADALMLSTWPYTTRGNRVHTALARWASPEKAPPEGELPEGYDEQAAAAARFLVIGITITAGFLFPVALLPGWIRWTSEIQPFTPLIDLLRHVLVGTPLEDAASIAVLKVLAFVAVLLPLSIYVLHATIQMTRRRATLIEY